MRERCHGRVSVGGLDAQCRRDAGVEVDGKHYCGRHSPNRPKTNFSRADVDALVERCVQAARVFRLCPRHGGEFCGPCLRGETSRCIYAEDVEDAVRKAAAVPPEGKGETK